MVLGPENETCITSDEDDFGGESKICFGFGTFADAIDQQTFKLRVLALRCAVASLRLR